MSNHSDNLLMLEFVRVCSISFILCVVIDVSVFVRHNHLLTYFSSLKYSIPLFIKISH